MEVMENGLRLRQSAVRPKTRVSGEVAGKRMGSPVALTMAYRAGYVWEIRMNSGCENGRPEWIRTIDLFRVKEAL
jgi:hypothetical protein